MINKIVTIAGQDMLLLLLECSGGHIVSHCRSFLGSRLYQIFIKSVTKYLEEHYIKPSFSLVWN